MLVVDEDVQREMLVMGDQRAADFHVAVVAAQQDFTARPGGGVIHAVVDVVRVGDSEVTVGEAALPHGEAVGNRFGEAADLPVGGKSRQVQAGGAGDEAALIAGYVAPRTRAGAVVVAADDGDGKRQQPDGEVAHDLRG